MNRRAFLTGLIAAPAVIRVAPLMRISPEPIYGTSPLLLTLDRWNEYLDAVINPPIIMADGVVFPIRTALPPATWRRFYQGVLLNG